MLVGSQPESPFVDLGNLFETRLEILSWFVLDPPILDEKCKVMLSVLTCDPARNRRRCGRMRKERAG